MHIIRCHSKPELGHLAARDVATCIKEAIKMYGEAVIVLATGASQFEMLDSLVETETDWSRVVAFHLDEYVGLSDEHPASFRRYLHERFVSRLPVPLKAFHAISGDGDGIDEAVRISGLLEGLRVDVACVGVGENGHLAFNDPPADFETEKPFIVVELDEQCRSQQLGEGWFETLESVPKTAISMTVRQIMRARAIVCACPDARKAVAIRDAVEGPVSPLCPSSIMQTHDECTVYVDTASASLLS